jgi:aromatic ring-opening dioxygenase catalytic subunit (LigB family)
VLERNGVNARLDVERGFDHGLYIPLLLMYPDADIPCIQLSLLTSLDAAEHVRLGEALSGLTGAGLLVLGSGFSFHNLRAFFGKDALAPDTRNQAFEDWLIDMCTNPSLDEQERTERLVHWDRAPAARYCHPREEHLLPLHVCYGLAKRACSAHCELTIMGKKASTYFW